MRRFHPRARQQGLLLRRLGDELLVYDLERHQAHCLSPSAAAVFEASDGHRSPAGIARHTGLPGPAVRVGLRRLQAARLLAEGPRPPLVVRREVLRRLVRAGLLLPVVASITAPTPAQAVTCTPNAGGCRGNGVACTASVQCCSCCCIGAGASFVCSAGGRCI